MRLTEWLFLGLAPVATWLESRFPRVPYRLLGRENRLNVKYFLLQNGLIYVGVVLVSALYAWRPPTWGLTAAGLSLPAQCVIMVLALDFRQYVLHYCQHRFDFYWQFHKLHHGTTELSWLAYGRMHPLDFFFMVLGSSLATTYALGANPLAWVLAYGVLDLVFSSFFAHLNVDLPRPDKLRWWARIIVTPNVHALHHSLAGQRPVNLGGVFMFWDVLFGTFESPRERRPAFGVSGEFPTSFSGQLLHPLRYWSKRSAPAGP